MLNFRTLFTSSAVAFLSVSLADNTKPMGQIGVVLAGEKPKKTSALAPKPPEVVPAEPPLPLADLPEGAQLKLSFSDYFDGTTLDPKKWKIRGDQKRFNGFWLKKNVTLNGKGHLHLTTSRDIDLENGETSYAGGAIQTKGRFEQTYGYFIARAQLQQASGDGYHCSFWLQSDGTGDTSDAGALGGRNGTEIDVIEKFRKDGNIQHALHWDGYGKEHAKANFSFPWPGITDGLHTFAVLWTPDHYTFYIDGVKTWTTTLGGVSQVPAFIRLTTEFSEGWNGNIADAKSLPDTFKVDWVRAYRLVLPE